MDLGLTIRPMGCIASERIRAIFRLVIAGLALTAQLLNGGNALRGKTMRTMMRGRCDRSGWLVSEDSETLPFYRCEMNCLGGLLWRLGPIMQTDGLCSQSRR